MFQILFAQLIKVKYVVVVVVVANLCCISQILAIRHNYQNYELCLQHSVYKCIYIYTNNSNTYLATLYDRKCEFQLVIIGSLID